MDERMVDLTVGLMSFDILVAILGGGDSDDDNEGEEDKAGRNCGKSREEL